MSFHVPEHARVTVHPFLASSADDGNNGVFFLESPEPGWTLAVIGSDGRDPDVPEAAGWEHVSVHAFRDRLKGRARQERVPSWKEMSYVKAIFWDGEDVVVQYHPRESHYINNHPCVLHLWRNTALEFPTPPLLLV